MSKDLLEPAEERELIPDPGSPEQNVDADKHGTVGFDSERVSNVPRPGGVWFNPDYWP